MRNLFEEVVADVRSLPEDEQERLAHALLVIMHQLQEDATWQTL